MRSGPVAARVAHRGKLGRRSRSAAAAGAAVAVTLLAAGCHVPGAGSSAAAPATSSITVAAVPGVDDAPLYLASRDGFFKAAGLTVTIQSYSSVAQEISALSKGSAEFALGDYADFFSAQDRTRRPGFSIVADAYDAAPSVMQVLALPSSGITTAGQLTGKTIGTSEPQYLRYSATLPYSIETLATQSVLTNDGVKLDTVKWKALPAKRLVSALRTHEVDAILATEPNIYQAQTQLGATEVIDSCSGQTASLPLDGYFTLGTFAQKSRATVLAFRSALLKAQAQAAQMAPVQAVLTSQMGTQAASLVTLGEYPTAVKASNLQRVASLMSTFNVLTPPINVARMIFR